MLGQQEKSSSKEFLQFVHQLEEKLRSLNKIHENLCQTMNLLHQTQENIYQDFHLLKEFFNEIPTQHDQDDDEIIPIDVTKSEWDDDDDDNEDLQQEKSSITNKSLFEREEERLLRKISPITSRTDFSSINSASSVESSSTLTNSSINDNRLNSLRNIRLANLKRNDRNDSTRTKSPKSVTFTLEDNSTKLTPNPSDLYSQIEQQEEEEQQQDDDEIHNESVDQMTTSNLPSSFETLSERNLYSGKSTNSNSLLNIRIHEIDPQHGEYLRLINLSQSDDYDLTDHFIQQNYLTKVLCRFRFPFNTILRAGQIITIYSGVRKDLLSQPPYIFIWKEQRKWFVGPQYSTILVKSDGQIICSYETSSILQPDSSSSDILFLHSKSKSRTTERLSIHRTPTKIRTKSGFTSSDYLQTFKPAYSQSTNNPIHPEYRPTIIDVPGHFRASAYPTTNVYQLLKRPKSSPFSSHSGSKKDQMIRQILHRQTVSSHPNNSIPT